MNLEKYGPRCIGQVIRIVDDTELIINVGEDDITVGDEIIVYAVGDTIKDLDGSVLGVYEYDKETLTVATTTENFSVCKTKMIRKKSALSVAIELSSPTVTGYEHMNINKDQVEKINIENKNIVLLGDPVKKG